MKFKAKLEINDFDPINKAEIELNKINIIAGHNASGKTTSSKLVYSFLSIISSDGMKLYTDNVKERISNIIFEFLQKTARNQPAKEKMLLYAERLHECSDIFCTEKLFKEIIEFIYNSSTPNNKDIVEKIDQLNKVSPFDIETSVRLEKILTRVLELEFNYLSPLKNKDSFVNFKGKDKQGFFMSLKSKDPEKISLHISDDLIESIKEREIVYLETPYILDFSIGVKFGLSSSYHQKSLLDKLTDETYKEDLFDKEFISCWITP